MMSKKHLIVLGVLFFFLPLAYLGAKQVTLRHELERLKNRYPFYTEEEIAVTEVVKKVSPSVVSIVQRKEVFGRGRQLLDLGNGFKIAVPGELQSKGKQVVGQGTGFVVAPNGIIATNRHVVADRTAEYEVIFNNGKKFSATVVKTDEKHDLALLKITGAKNLKPVSLAESGKTRIGQTVIVIGNSLGELQNTVTKGVISALNRSISASDSAGNIEQLSKVIQTDAAINSGNSGGPMLNTSGEVVGISVAVNQSAENIGFAIPVKELLKFIENLENPE